MDNKPLLSMIATLFFSGVEYFKKGLAILAALAILYMDIINEDMFIIHKHV